MELKANHSTVTGQKRAADWISNAVATKKKCNALTAIGFGSELTKIKVQCDYPDEHYVPCGKVTEVSASIFNRGVIQSCGCKRKVDPLRWIYHQIKNRTLFGHLRVVAPGSTLSKCLATCEFEGCGIQKEVETKLLRKGRIKTCGKHAKKEKLIVVKPLKELKILAEAKYIPNPEVLLLVKHEKINLEGLKGSVLSNAKRKQEGINRILGKTFGWLTILKINGDTVKCHCVCGKIVEKYRNGVIYGKTSSCGCKHSEMLIETLKANGTYIDHTGERFGKLLIIEKDKDHYVCICDCGKEKRIFVGNLLSGDIQTCGCSSVEMRIQTNLEKYGVQSVAVNESKAEIEIRDFFKEQGLDASKTYIEGYGNHRKFELDVWIPSIKLAIEHNGARYHADDTKHRLYHNWKRLAAKRDGIRLIQIFDFEWKKKKRQIKSFLKSAAGLNQITAGARSLDIAICEFFDIKNFLNEYHILGESPGKLYISVKFKGELVAVAVFRKHHVKNQGYEMSRWCVKENYSLPGALTKVSRLAKENLKESLITWADLRFSNGEGYLKAGWELDAQLDPDYFYYDQDTKKIIYKNQRRKSKVHTPAGMTESEHASQDGLLRLWDCGKLRFIF